MKIKFLLYTFFFLGFTSTSIAQKIEAVSGKATDIAISPKDGAVYIVGTSKNILQYNQQQRKFTQVGPNKTNAVEVVVNTDGKIYMLNASGQRSILTANRKSWKKLPSERLLTLASDKQDKNWALAKAGNKVQYYESKTWKVLPKSPRVIKRIAPYSSNLCYVIKTDQSIHQFTKGTWRKLPGKAIDITVDLANGDVYIVGTSKRILKWNKKAKKWDTLSGSRQDFSRIAVHNKAIWALTGKKRIYRYQSPPSTGTRTRASGLADAEYYLNNNSKKSDSTPKDENKYEGNYRFTMTRILTYSPDEKCTEELNICGTMGIYVSAQTKSGKTEIKPIDNKRNRMVDLPPAAPLKVPPKYVRVAHTLKMRTDQGIKDFYYYREQEIGRIREFNIYGEAANPFIAFDLQTNLRLKYWVGEHKYHWKRQRVEINQVRFGKEEFLKIESSDKSKPILYIGYIISRH